MKPAACLISVFLLVFGPVFFADAHSWYPLDCCSGEDCAPVESMAWVVPASGGAAQLMVRSKVGTAIVPAGFPVRESQDDHMHVCMQFDPFGAMEVICLFMPQGLS